MSHLKLRKEGTARDTNFLKHPTVRRNAITWKVLRRNQYGSTVATTWVVAGIYRPPGGVAPATMDHPDPLTHIAWPAEPGRKISRIGMIRDRRGGLHHASTDQRTLWLRTDNCVEPQRITTITIIFVTQLCSVTLRT